MKNLPPNQRALHPGQAVRVEHNAQIVSQVEKDNPYWYIVEYPSGEQETVSLTRINLIADKSRAVIDSDASIQIFSSRMSPAGALDLLVWLETHKAELQAAVEPDEDVTQASKRSISGE